MTIIQTPVFSTPTINHKAITLPPNTTIRQLQPLPPAYKSSTQWNPMLNQPAQANSQVVGLLPILHSPAARSAFVQGYNGLNTWSIQGFLTVKNMQEFRPTKLKHVAVVLSVGRRGYSSFKQYQNSSNKSIDNMSATLTTFNKSMAFVDSQCIGLLEGCELKPAETIWIPFCFTFDSHLPSTFDIHQSHWSDSFLYYALTGVVNDGKLTMTAGKYIPVADYNDSLLTRVLAGSEYLLSVSKNIADVEVLFPSRFMSPDQEVNFMLTIRSPKSASIKVITIQFQIFEHHHHSDPDCNQPDHPVKIYEQTIKPSNNHDFENDKTIHTQQITIAERLPEIQPVGLLNFDGVWLNGKVSITHTMKVTVMFLSSGVVPNVAVVEGGIEVVGFSKEVLEDVKVKFPKLVERLTLG
ncbi:hypothetical protein HDU76_005657 [Blyttiomyces sp. JEL0837]|nr:hypothetical protein HDU76_005657 [Blyttiomyces sp. JEL0837]